MIGLVACGDGDAEQRSGPESLTEAAPATPRLPDATMQRLVDSVDYVDLLFYDYEFSMSLDDPSGIRMAIAQIGEQPARLRADCKPIGRVFYQVQGRAAAEADLYFSPGCTYLAFVDRASGTVDYANALSDLGKEFYNNQFVRLVDGYTPVQ